MVEIGRMNTVAVKEEVRDGYHLSHPDMADDIFLPEPAALEDIDIGQTIEVFLYMGSENQLVATSETPLAMVGEYGLLEVKEVQEFGAFFDWGIFKDLLVPGNLQKEKVRVGEEHIVRVCLEESTDRVYGTTKLGQYIEDSKFDFEEKDKVKIIPAIQMDLGYRVIINKRFIGMIYHNEIHQDVRIGFEYDAFVKKIREDGLVDVALQVQGIKNLDYSKVKILNFLKENNGKTHLNDKSSPNDIKLLLGMSKKTFKSAIGMLYKDRKILIEDDGIQLVEDATR